MSQFRRGPILEPWADCLLSTSELVGEDSQVIIRLGASQLNELDLLSLNWGQILYPPCFIVVVLARQCSVACVWTCELLIVSAL